MVYLFSLGVRVYNILPRFWTILGPKDVHLSPSGTPKQFHGKCGNRGKYSQVSVFNRDLNFMGFPDKPPGVVGSYLRFLVTFRRYILVLDFNHDITSKIYFELDTYTSDDPRISNIFPLHPD